MSTSNHHSPQSHRPQNHYYDSMHHPNISSSTTTTATVISSSISSARRKGSLPPPTTNKKLSKQEEIDFYAQQLIEYTANSNQSQQYQEESGGSNIDDSLGSYITNCLRTSLSEMNIDITTDITLHQHRIIDISAIPDYESFCELIQEHCQLTYEGNDDGYQTNPIAIQVLQKILNALTTQQIPSDDIILFQNTQLFQNQQSNTMGNDHRSITIQNNPLLPESLWKEVLSETGSTNNDNGDVEYTDGTSSSPRTDSTVQMQQQHDADLDQDVVAKIVSSDHDVKTILRTDTNLEQQVIQQHEEVEFQQRDQYVEQEFHHDHHQDVDDYIRLNIVNMLLQWYAAQDLCYDAAYEATCMAHNNTILAQYIISSAFTQMPICKHLLNDGKCYRADCTFNHNIDHHTCVFWMKSRGCSKRDSAIEPCRFLHGFSSKVLENIPEQIQQQATAADHSHNGTITPYQNVRDFYATSVPTNTTVTTIHNHPSNANGTSSSAKSFANIASKGYSTKKSFTQLQPDQLPTTKSSSTAVALQQALQQLSTILIPQNLWQAHENRDASAFYISDPLERYYTVSASTTTSVAVSSKSSHHNHNIIDLHYQSIKTFPVVLDTVLPNKLESLTPSDSSSNVGSNTNGIWIVTGTGHHVNTQRTHQKGGSTLENAVLEYLISNFMLPPTNEITGATPTISSSKYRIYKGRDKNGKGGAIFIQRKY